MGRIPAAEPPRRSPASRALLPLVLAAWCGLIFALSAQPHLGTDLGTLDVFLRKCAHVAEYAVLALLASMTARQEGASARVEPVVAALFSLAYSCSDELHQTFVAGRHGTPVDVAIDSIGITIGLLIARRTRPERASRRNDA
jgi:VanZ family protein